MENDICQFEVIESPNRRYANTVNLVFFKAFPPSKNFDIYIDGLKNWNRYMKSYPNSQLQIFIDRNIAEDTNVAAVLKSLNIRVFLFECPEYLMDNGYHMGLFGTMVRFFPMFDVNKHPMNVAHFQELEPTEYSVPTFEAIDKFSRMKTAVELGTIYLITNIYTTGFEDQLFFEENIPYPWMLAGRFCAKTKVPFSLWKDYLEGVKNNKQFIDRYQQGKNADKARKDERHGKYSFGIDETFLNSLYMPWLINNGYGIGIIIHYYISDVFYYIKQRLFADKRTQRLLNYILQKNQSISASIREIDTMYYAGDYKPHKTTARSKEVCDRFYEVVEKYPDWCGKGCSNVLRLFKGYESRVCMLVVQNNKLVEIKDILR